MMKLFASSFLLLLLLLVWMCILSTGVDAHRNRQQPAKVSSKPQVDDDDQEMEGTDRKKANDDDDERKPDDRNRLPDKRKPSNRDDSDEVTPGEGDRKGKHGKKDKHWKKKKHWGGHPACRKHGPDHLACKKHRKHHRHGEDRHRRPGQRNDEDDHNFDDDASFRGKGPGKNGDRGRNDKGRDSSAHRPGERSRNPKWNGNFDQQSRKEKNNQANDDDDRQAD